MSALNVRQKIDINGCKLTYSNHVRTTNVNMSANFFRFHSCCIFIACFTLSWSALPGESPSYSRENGGNKCTPETVTLHRVFVNLSHVSSLKAPHFKLLPGLLHSEGDPHAYVTMPAMTHVKWWRENDQKTLTGSFVMRSVEYYDQVVTRRRNSSLNIFLLQKSQFSATLQPPSFRFLLLSIFDHGMKWWTFSMALSKHLVNQYSISQELVMRGHPLRSRAENMQEDNYDHMRSHLRLFRDVLANNLPSDLAHVFHFSNWCFT